jgi:excisionase family DNA binding protein
MAVTYQERYWTPEQVAERFKVSSETIRRMIRQKRLTAIKFGSTWRISETAIQQYIEQQNKDNK